MIIDLFLPSQMFTDSIKINASRHTYLLCALKRALLCTRTFRNELDISLAKANVAEASVIPFADVISDANDFLESLVRYRSGALICSVELHTFTYIITLGIKLQSDAGALPAFKHKVTRMLESLMPRINDYIHEVESTFEFVKENTFEDMLYEGEIASIMYRHVQRLNDFYEFFGEYNRIMRYITKSITSLEYIKEYVEKIRNASIMTHGFKEVFVEVSNYTYYAYVRRNTFDANLTITDIIINHLDDENDLTCEPEHADYVNHQREDERDFDDGDDFDFEGFDDDDFH